MAQKRFATCIQCGQPVRGDTLRGRCPSCYRTWLLGGNTAVPVPQLRDEKLSQGRRPAASTQFEPGTDGKKEVMRLRAGRGESCFHPEDAKGGDASEYRNTHRTETDDDD